jgi:hypothetical protein
VCSNQILCYKIPFEGVQKSKCNPRHTIISFCVCYRDFTLFSALSVAGGQEHHASALSSAASVLRTVSREAGVQNVVLAGCEDGMIVGLDSVTAATLWKLDVSAVSTPAAGNPGKPQAFNNPRVSGVCFSCSVCECFSCVLYARDVLVACQLAHG